MSEAVNRKSVLLTERDTKLLLDFYKYRYLSVSQIQGLYFPSEQTTYRRLRALRSGGYIKGFNVPNITEQIFCLDKAGAETVAGSLQIDSADLKWKESAGTPKDYYFLRHFLNVNDFRIALNQACGRSSIKLLGFIPEYYGEKTPRGGISKYIKDVVCDIRDGSDQISHTPDGVFALEKDGKPALFFLEIDRGTEVVSSSEKGVLKSLRFYLNYLLDGKYQRYQRDFNCAQFKGFRALIVTNLTARLEHFREAAEKLTFPDHSKRFIWLATEDEITPETLFNSIWKSLDVRDSTKYGIT